MKDDVAELRADFAARLVALEVRVREAPHPVPVPAAVPVPLAAPRKRRALALVPSAAPTSASLPATRGQCPTARPCPHTRCKYILPDGDCTLDEADRGGMTLEAVAVHFGQTRENIRQVETKALAKLGRALARLDAEEERQRNAVATASHLQKKA